MAASEHRTYARTGTSRQLFDGQTVAAAARREPPTARSQAASDLMDRSRLPPDGRRARRGAPRRDGPSSARQVEQREQEVVEQVAGLRVIAAHARPTPDAHNAWIIRVSTTEDDAHPNLNHGPDSTSGISKFHEAFASRANLRSPSRSAVGGYPGSVKAEPIEEA